MSTADLTMIEDENGNDMTVGGPFSEGQLCKIGLIDLLVYPRLLEPPISNPESTARDCCAICANRMTANNIGSDRFNMIRGHYDIRSRRGR